MTDLSELRQVTAAIHHSRYLKNLFLRHPQLAIRTEQEAAHIFTREQMQAQLAAAHIHDEESLSSALRSLRQINHTEALRVVEDTATLGQVRAPDAPQNGGFPAAATSGDAHKCTRLERKPNVLTPLYASVYPVEQK